MKVIYRPMPLRLVEQTLMSVLMRVRYAMEFNRSLPLNAGRRHAGPCPDQTRPLACGFTVCSLP